MKRAPVISLPMAAVLTACAAPPPAPRDPPPLAVPAKWQQAAPGAPLAAPADGWWTGFGDPVLVQWVERALAHNTDLATAAARVQEARAQERLARAALFPTLDFTLGASRSRTLNAFGKASDADAVQPQFQAAYEADLWGRLHDTVRAAEAGTLSAEQAQAAARLGVAAAAATGYLTLRTLDARLALLQQTLVSRDASLHAARRRALAGYTSDLEWRQAEAEREGTAQQVPQVQAAITRQADALAVLAGEPPGATARGRALADLHPPALPLVLPSELLRRRPDVAQAESALAASDATLDAARAQFLPQLRLAASIGSLWSSALPDTVALWSLGGSVLAPIFEGGRLRANADATAARREQAAWAYRRVVLNALREVEDTLSALARLRKQRERLQAQRDAVASALQHADKRYRAGYSSYLEQLDAQRALLATELALVQVQGDELAAAVALQQAMGGGWQR
jgi:NodT family efflux transporter outer membrane factor (OMF) lipoprotein